MAAIFHPCLDKKIQDEDYCDQNICRKNEQLCLNGVCIPKYYHPMRCDGKMDCTDGSDESGCPTTTPNNIISVDTNSDITIEVESKVCLIRP